MKASSLRVRFAVLLLPFTALFIALSTFAILAIRGLLLDLPERSEGLQVADQLEYLFNKLDDIDRAIRNYQEDYPLRLSAFLEVQRMDLERLHEELSDHGAFQRYPELEREFLHFLREVERHVGAGPAAGSPRPDLIHQSNVLGSSLQKALDRYADSLYADMARIERTARLATWSLGAGMIAGLALTALLAWRLSIRTLGPIEAFIDSAERIGAGEIDAEIVYRGNDEFRHLAAAFSKMSQQLRASHARLSDEARSERERMSSLLKHLPFPIFLFDHAGCKEVANHSGAQLLAAPELNGQLPSELLQLLDKTRETGVSYAPDKLDAAVYLHAYQDELAFLPRLFPIDSKNLGGGIALVLLDVTKLRLSSDLRRDLLSIVSHELKTPLTSTMLGLRVLLESEDPLTGLQREMIETASSELKRHHRTIENLLDLGFLVKGGRALNKGPIFLADFFESLREEWAATATRNAKHLEIAVPCSPGLELYVDAVRLRLALGCVVANGLRYTPREGTVRLSADIADEIVWIKITDEGPGIPQEYRKRIFDRFFRIPGTVPSGEGVGLSVARELIEAHSGSIWCEENTPRGSCFVVRLPTFDPSLGSP